MASIRLETPLARVAAVPDSRVEPRGIRRRELHTLRSSPHQRIAVEQELTDAEGCRS
jgi:hypothetical protein